ncbi:MAG: hypothetical protein ABI652_01085 [Acidobacteriota bacterium]
MPVVAMLFALALLKGIRMPNRWSVTHYLFNYQTGFIKRGLFGEVLRQVLGQWTAHYFAMAAVAIAVGVVMLLLIVRECRRLPRVAETLPFLLVFVASPAISFSVHLVGYLEEVTYIVWLLVLLQRRRWALQVAAALAAAVVLPLIHDASILWVGALTCLTLIAGAAARDRSPRARLAAIAAVGVVWVASTLVVSSAGRVSPERAGLIRDQQTAFFDIRPRQDAFQTLTQTSSAALVDMKQRWAEPDVQQDMVLSLFVFAPAMIFLGVVAVRRARICDDSAAIRVAASALVVLAIASPLLLHVVAWDRHRWNSLATLNAGLAALVLVGAPRREQQSRAPASPMATIGVALAISVWSIAADPVFFDNYAPSHPPYTGQVYFLLEALRTGDRAMWIPPPGN